MDVNLSKEASKAYPTSVPMGQKEAAAVVVGFFDFFWFSTYLDNSKP